MTRILHRCVRLPVRLSVPLIAVAFGLVPLALQADPLAGQDAALKAGQARRTDTPPTIDGRLNDAAWSSAPAMTDFVQLEPNDGQPASEETEIRILFDDDAVYVGAWAKVADPGTIIPGEQIRDAELSESDAILLAFDTYNDEQNAFVFATTPAGIEYDGQVANAGQGGGGFLGGGQRRFQIGAGGGFNKNWDGSWTVAVTRDDDGWYAEFRIPFNTLRYGANDVWGVNIGRRVRHRNEQATWAPVPRQFTLYRLEYAGDLEGLETPFRRSGTVTPYMLATRGRNWSEGDTAFAAHREFGADAKLQVTSGLTLDATYNTDFAQVEADDQQVNLTRFSLFFPEKRPFFLENAGFFTIGGGGADLFFSRRIGLAEGGTVPIVGGGRLSGRTGGFNVGLLHIATGLEDGVQDPNQYSVARIARELPGRSRLGGAFMYRRGDAEGDYNQTLAVDGQLGLGEAWTASGWAARTETPDATGDEHAFNGTLGWTTREWRANVQYQYFGEAFNPEIGFLPRTGHQYLQLFAMRYIRPTRVFREIRPHVSYYTYLSRKADVEDGFEESGRLHLDVHWEFPDGMELHTGFNWLTQGLYEPFSISGTDVTVPEGTYRGWESQVRFWTNESAPLSFNGGWNIGHFLTGSRRSVQGAITGRVNSTLTVSARLDYNNVTLEEGDFVTTLAGLNLGYFFAPNVYLQALVQSSTQLDIWSSNLRFGWLGTAGTGLFLVYNEAQGIGDISGDNLIRSLGIKYSRQIKVLGL